MTSALILTFHGIDCDGLPPDLLGDARKSRYTLSSDRFIRALDLCGSRAGVTVRDLRSLPPPSPSGSEPVALTFDDGYLSDYRMAFPALLERGLRGTFFITASRVGEEGFVSRTELREMAGAGMEIASHGLTHRYLTALGRSDALREIRESRERLTEEIGNPVTSFAPVGGHFRRWMLEAAREAGYHSFASMVPGRTRLCREPFLLRRNHLLRVQDEAHLARLLSGEGGALAREWLRYRSLHLAKAALGLRSYDRLKGWLLGKRVPAGASRGSSGTASKLAMDEGRGPCT